MLWIQFSSSMTPPQKPPDGNGVNYVDLLGFYPFFRPFYET